MYQSNEFVQNVLLEIVLIIKWFSEKQSEANN